MSECNVGKVVVTGLGVVSTLGSDVETFWSNLCSGVIGYGPVPELQERQTPFRVGGHIGDLPPGPQAAAYDRATRLALIAAHQAVTQAGLAPTRQGTDPESTVGVVMGTTCGANDQLELPGFEQHWFSGEYEQCPAAAFERYDHSAIANAVSRRYGFCGPSYVVGTACAAGNHAIGEAFNLIREGQADIVVCGGADAFTLLPVFGFYAMKSLAKERCTPFDRDRTGTILGEGAAALVLESSKSAGRRGVTPLARLSAWALNCDARNFAAPLDTGERCAQLIVDCLRAADIDKGEIDYINAHGTGTLSNDSMEARGVTRVYGAQPESRLPIVSSVKGMLGHTLGAAGALEGVVSTLAIMRGRIPPNTPVSLLDEGIDLNLACAAIERPLRHVLSLSFAFGGCNVATLFSRP
jgi:3-oxoacyl-[acyl-carrier-protein] synthase II